MSIHDLTPAVGSGSQVSALSSQVSSSLLFDIPDCDYPEWLRDVEAEERARVREIFEAFREMRRARSLKAGALSAALKRAHLGWGWSAKALLNLYRAYSNGGHKPSDWRKVGAVYAPGDWRILLRDYKGKDAALPEEFKRWLGEQFVQFKGRRDCSLALWRHVVHEVWLKGHPVPGFGTIDEWCRRAGRARPHPLLVRPGELPAGWSVDTFRRALPKRKADALQASHGYLAAHRHQPDQVLTDRSPLMPLQFVFMDDNRPDGRCLFLRGGRGEMVYPLLVAGLDGASAVDVAAVFKPRAMKSPEAEDAAERKARHGVTQDMADLVVVETLRRWGLPPWPVTFVHENAAACVSTRVRHALRELFGERIRFEATSVVHQKMLEHGWVESGGAPYTKSPIESFWRILMTQTARLPGATGPRFDTMPPELKDIERYQLALVEQAGGLASLVEKLKHPLLTYDQMQTAIEDALRLLRFRTAHKLQGFSRVQEWRRSPAHGYEPLETFALLSPDEQAAIATNGDKDAIISRLECPAERFVRLLRGVELTPVDPDLLAWLQGPTFPVTVRDGKIALDRAALGDDLAIFREVDHPLLAPECEGLDYEAALPPEGDRIVLTRDGRVLGSVARQGRVCRADTEALHREMGRVAAARKSDRERFAGYYLADTATALLELRQHNEAALAAAPAALPAGEASARQPRLTAAKKRARMQDNRASAERARRLQEMQGTL